MSFHSVPTLLNSNPCLWWAKTFIITSTITGQRRAGSGGAHKLNYFWVKLFVRTISFSSNFFRPNKSVFRWTFLPVTYLLKLVWCLLLSDSVFVPRAIKVQDEKINFLLFYVQTLIVTVVGIRVPWSTSRLGMSAFLLMWKLCRSILFHILDIFFTSTLRYVEFGLHRQTKLGTS